MEHLHFSTCNAMDKVLKPAMPLSLLGFIVHLAMLLPRSGASSALSNGVEYYHFSTCGTEKVLKYQHRYREHTAYTPLHCGMLCRGDPACKSFDYDPLQQRCYLGSVAVGNDCQEMVTEEGGSQHYAEGPQCMEGEERLPDKTCQCPKAFAGPGCRELMQDCADWDEYFTHEAVLWIHPSTSDVPFQVFCGKLQTKVRTLLMNRNQGDVSFNKDWQAYKVGFGNLSGDHWLGLEHMHLLTENRRYTLRFSIRLGLAPHDAYYLTYNDVHIGNESSYYRLDTVSLKNVGVPPYDCLYPDLVTMPFSTHDADNDGNDDVSCSSLFGGGWWYNGTAGCALCNPTGRLLLPQDGRRSGIADEVFWGNSLGDFVPVSVMMYLLPQ